MTNAVTTTINIAPSWMFQASVAIELIENGDGPQARAEGHQLVREMAQKLDQLKRELESAKSELHAQCDLCGNGIVGYRAFDAYPLDSGYACSKCDFEKVIPARLELTPPDPRCEVGPSW